MAEDSRVPRPIHAQWQAGSNGAWRKLSERELQHADSVHPVRRQFEAVPESLKNVLLVMNEAGFLRPPHDPRRTPEHAALWDATFDRIQPFLPELQGERVRDPVVPGWGNGRLTVARGMFRLVAELFPPPKVPVPFSSAGSGAAGQPSDGTNGAVASSSGAVESQPAMNGGASGAINGTSIV